MSKTFFSQPTQVFRSETYDDTLLPGVDLQTSSSNLETDLNALRSQIKQLLWAQASGSWTDAITAPSGTNPARGLSAVNLDLTDLEQKRFTFRRQNLNLVAIATGSNVAQLSVVLGTAPSGVLALGDTSAAGAITAQLLSSYGVHSLALVSGTTSTIPKNLVIVRDAYTHNALTNSAGYEIYGLLQAENGTVTGDAANDTNKRTQISFIYELTLNGTSSFVMAPASVAGGHTVQYTYPVRLALDDLPEDAYLGNHIFLDMPTVSVPSAASSGLSQTEHEYLNVLPHDIAFNSFDDILWGSNGMITMSVWNNSSRGQLLQHYKASYNSNRLIAALTSSVFLSGTLFGKMIESTTYDNKRRITNITRTRIL